MIGFVEKWNSFSRRSYRSQFLNPHFLAMSIETRKWVTSLTLDVLCGRVLWLVPCALEVQQATEVENSRATELRLDLLRCLATNRLPSCHWELRHFRSVHCHWRIFSFPIRDLFPPRGPTSAALSCSFHWPSWKIKGATHNTIPQLIGFCLDFWFAYLLCLIFSGCGLGDAVGDGDWNCQETKLLWEMPLSDRQWRSRSCSAAISLSSCTKPGGSTENCAANRDTSRRHKITFRGCPCNTEN